MTVATNEPARRPAVRRHRRSPEEVVGRPRAAGIPALLVACTSAIWGGCASHPAAQSPAQPPTRMATSGPFVSAAWLPERECGFAASVASDTWDWTNPPASFRQMGPPAPGPIEPATADPAPTVWLGSLMTGCVVEPFDAGPWMDTLDVGDHTRGPALFGADAGAGDPAPDASSVISALGGRDLSGSIMSFAAGLFMLVVISIPAGLAIASSCCGGPSRAPPIAL